MKYPTRVYLLGQAFFYMYCDIINFNSITLPAHLHFIQASKVNLRNIHVNEIFDYATIFQSKILIII
jgi:hypothetical protein